MSTTTLFTPPQEGSPQIPSSPDDSHSSSSWAATDSGSMSSESWSPQRHVPPPASSPGSSQDHVPPPLNLGDDFPSDSSHSWSTGSTIEEYYSSALEQPSTDGSHASSLDQSSSEESHPLTPGSADNQPPPASSSNSGSSAQPNPPPRAKRPRPEDEPWGFLTKIVKGKFKPRFSGSGALNAAQGDMQGTFNSRAYVTASSLPLL
jgi:hypothetical protein